jgi:hypothetical protein
MVIIINKEEKVRMNGQNASVNEVSFHEYAVVACGTMNRELKMLNENGFLNARKLLFTKQGRHEVTRELESQLIEKISSAKEYSEKIIVVYGGEEVSRELDSIWRRVEEETG